MEKSYKNKEWLAEQLESKSIKELSKELKVSQKLLNLLAVQFGLIRRTPDLKLP